jgi:hypothetical protein
MVLTRTQRKRKAAGDPIFSRRRKRGRKHTNIGDLPDELLMLIIEDADFISPWCTNPLSTLHALCLVNRRFNRLTSPYLYDLFVFNDDDIKAPYLMMRTLLEAPPRGTLVKTLYSYPQEMGPLVDDLMDWDVSPTLREWNVPNVDRWLDALLDGCRNTLAAILLCYMPKVVEIRIIKGADESGLHGSSFLSPILCAAWRHPERLDLVHRFGNLTSLYMGYDSVHAELILGFLPLASVVTSHLVRCGWVYERFLGSSPVVNSQDRFLGVFRGKFGSRKSRSLGRSSVIGA